METNNVNGRIDNVEEEPFFGPEGQDKEEIYSETESGSAGRQKQYLKYNPANGKLKLLILALAVLFCVFTYFLCKDSVGFIINYVAIGLMVAIILWGILAKNRGLKKLEDCAADLNNAVDIINNFHSQTSYSADDFIKNEPLFQEPTLRDAYAEYQSEVERLRIAGNYQYCDISDYINEKLLSQAANSSFNDLVGGMMTGLGILGTFVGLTFGLGNFQLGSTTTSDPNAMMSSINALMEGIKVAFLTSIFGMVFSLIFNWGYRGILSNSAASLSDFLDAYYDIVSPRPENEAYTRLINSQEEQKKSMAQFAEDIAIAFSKHLEESLPNAVSQGISDSIVPTMKGIQERMSQLAEQVASAQDQNLERITNDFVGHLDQTMGSQFERLGNSIKMICDWQESMSTQIQSLISEMTVSGERLVTVNQDLQKSMEGFDGYLTTLDSCQKTLTDSFNKTQTAYTEMIDLSKKQQEGMASIIEKENQSIENLDMISMLFKEQADTLKEELERQSELMVNFYAYQRELLQKSNESISAELLNQSQTYLAALDKQAKQLTDTMRQAAEDMTREFNTIKELHGSMIDGMNTSSAAMRNSSDAMVSASNDLTKNLDSAMERTYEQIDKQLSEIVLHLSGTLTEIKEITERVPKVVRLSTEENMKIMKDYIAKIEASQRTISETVKEFKKTNR